MQTIMLCWVAALMTVMPAHRTVNTPVVRLLKCNVSPAYLTKFRNVLNEYVHSSMNAAGNIMAEAYYEENDSTTLWIIERWTDENTLAKNGESKAAKAIVDLMKHALAAPADTIIMNDLEPLNKKELKPN